MPAASPARATSRRITKAPALAQSQDAEHESDPAPTNAPTTPTIAPSAEPSQPPEPTELNLIASLFSDTLPLEDLARTHGLSLRALIAWAERRDIAGLRRSMRELADDRADLIVSRARTAAAHRLQALSAAAVNEETSRKACVDLLRLRPAPGAATTCLTPNNADNPQGTDTDDARTDSDDDLLAQLDRLARITHAPRLTQVDDRDLGAPSSGAD